jgi:hypothetical protein
MLGYHATMIGYGLNQLVFFIAEQCAHSAGQVKYFHD